MNACHLCETEMHPQKGVGNDTPCELLLETKKHALIYMIVGHSYQVTNDVNRGYLCHISLNVKKCIKYTNARLT